MARPTKYEQWKQAISRGVTKLTPEVVTKLKEAFAIGATVEEACFYAEISDRTYYRWIEKNPELCQEFDRMRQKLPLKAKENIARQIQDYKDIGLSKWLIERQQPESYGETVKLQHSGEISQGETVSDEDNQAIEEFHKKLKENAVKRIIEKAKKEGKYIEPKIK
jgi:hypothetical protein